MPRIARRKNPDLPHHVMCRSISEIRLFRNDDDKIKYLQLMAQYCQKFECKVLTYCFMDTPDFKAIAVFLMRNLCNYSYKEICKEIGNLTLSRVAILSNTGLKLLSTEAKYKDFFSKLLEEIE